MDAMDIDADRGGAKPECQDSSSAEEAEQKAHLIKRDGLHVLSEPLNSDDDDDDDDHVVGGSSGGPAVGSGRSTTFGNQWAKWDEESVRRHLLLPHLLSGYLQLGFNVAMIAFIMYTLGSFVSSVHYDIDNKVAEFASDVLNEMADCSKSFRENRCGTKDEVPVLRSTCAMWERCMSRDPTTVGRTKLSAHTLGEILNSFVEPLSYKTMGFFTLFLFGFMIASNIAFKLGSSKPGLATAALNLPPKQHFHPEITQHSSSPPRSRSRRRASLASPNSAYRRISTTPSTADMTRY